MEYHIHPAISSFPIAFLTVVVVAEFLQLWRPRPSVALVAAVNLWLAALAYLVAFFSGYLALDTASRTFEVSPEVIDFHHTVGRAGLFLIWPVLVLQFLSRSTGGRQKVLSALYVVLLVLTYGITAYGSFLGGRLVFEHGAGVSAPVEKLRR